MRPAAGQVLHFSENPHLTRFVPHVAATAQQPEYGWLPAVQAVRLYAYRFDAAPFRPFGSPRPHAMVATSPVTPLGPAEPVGDLLALHEAADIQFRLVASLWPVRDQMVTSTLEFSAIRLRNAEPRK